MRMQSRALLGVSLAALATHARPAALAGPVRAETDPKKVVEAIGAAFTDFKDNHRREMDAVQSALDNMAQMNAAGLAGPRTSDLMPADPTYSQTYASWFRQGDQSAEADLKTANASGNRATIQAAMSVGTDTAGGYLAPVEWDRRISKTLLPLSPMRRLARVVTTTVRAYSTVYSDGAWGSGWVGEVASRPETATPTLSSLAFPAGEIYANPHITQQLLEDADFDVEAWLATEVGDEFSRQESVAFLSGNGVNKPRGLLTYVTGGTGADVHPLGNITTVPTGQAAALGDADKLIDFVYSLSAPYRQNAKWLMNSLTAAVIAKMKDGDGNYLWRETYVAGQPATLLGYPVEIDEGMPAIAAGALPIAFGDFQRAYVINDRLGVNVLRDPYTAKPYVGFYTRKRVGGGLDDPKAIRFVRVAVS